MKKINSNKLQAALLRGAVAVSGSTCTLIAMLFCNNIYSFIFTAFIGGGLITLIDEQIINSSNSK